MRNRKGAFIGILLWIILISGIFINAQTIDCKVTLPAISGTYSGQCKNGLANGRGIAQGVDRYEGQFLKGAPDGKGTYTWANGSVYKGQWDKGLKEGAGQMLYALTGRDSVVTGYWKKDNYVGKELIMPYTVIRKVGVISYSFRKISDTGNEVIVRFLMGGAINSRISGFSMASNNGSQFKSGPKEGVQNIFFPFDLNIKYTTSNPISMATFDVVFDCTITEPGKWEITINN